MNFMPNYNFLIFKMILDPVFPLRFRLQAQVDMIFFVWRLMGLFTDLK